MSTKVSAMTVVDSASGMPPDEKLACNIGVMKTKNGLLKLAQIILAIVLIVVFLQEGDFVSPYAFLALFLCSLSTLVPAFLLLVSYLVSPRAAGTLPKLFFELLYNVYAFLFYTCISIALLIIFSTREGMEISDDDDDNDVDDADDIDDAINNENKMIKKCIALIVLGFGNAALYFMSSFYGYRTFKSS